MNDEMNNETVNRINELTSNPSKFAQVMLEWEQLQRQANALAAQLEFIVIALEQTQTIGNVRVTYSKGRKTYDYEEATTDHPMVSPTTIMLHTKTVETIDWKAICEHAGIGDQEDDIKFTQSPPSAKIKLLNH